MKSLAISVKERENVGKSSSKALRNQGKVPCVLYGGEKQVCFYAHENDLRKIKNKIKIPLNLEIAATKEMLRIASKSKPPFICIVPEKRKEITTEGGLNLVKYYKKIIINFHINY